LPFSFEIGQIKNSDALELNTGRWNGNQNMDSNKQIKSSDALELKTSSWNKHRNMNLNRWIKNSVAWELKPANGTETKRWTADQLVNSECNQGKVKPAMWIKIWASGFGISCWI
jgi:hypothetical protein